MKNVCIRTLTMKHQRIVMQLEKVINISTKEKERKKEPKKERKRKTTTTNFVNFF